jgi:hypothetical protein
LIGPCINRLSTGGGHPATQGSTNQLARITLTSAAGLAKPSDASLAAVGRCNDDGSSGGGDTSSATCPRMTCGGACRVAAGLVISWRCGGVAHFVPSDWSLVGPHGGGLYGWHLSPSVVGLVTLSGGGSAGQPGTSDVRLAAPRFGGGQRLASSDTRLEYRPLENHKGVVRDRRRSMSTSTIGLDIYFSRETHGQLDLHPVTVGYLRRGITPDNDHLVRHNVDDTLPLLSSTWLQAAVNRDAKPLEQLFAEI